MKLSEAGGNSQAVLIIQKNPLSWDGEETTLPPRGFGFSLAIRRSLGFCAQWVCMVPSRVCWCGVQVLGSWSMLGRPSQSELSPDVCTGFSDYGNLGRFVQVLSLPHRLCPHCTVEFPVHAPHELCSPAFPKQMASISTPLGIPHLLFSFHIHSSHPP